MNVRRLGVRGALTLVRPATDADAELLVRWHADPGEPVGYLQAWREGDAGGIDMFMIPAARGRGLGPDAARALARHLREECGWTRITVDPYTWNETAIDAWRKAGFVDVEEQPADEEHPSPWLLMVWDG